MIHEPTRDDVADVDLQPERLDRFELEFSTNDPARGRKRIP